VVAERGGVIIKNIDKCLVYSENIVILQIHKALKIKKLQITSKIQQLVF